MKKKVYFLLFIAFLFLHGCEFVEKIIWDLPKYGAVEIYEPSNSSILDTSALIMGYVEEMDGAEIIQKGICYSSTSNPSLKDNVFECGRGSGDFNAEIHDLNAGSQYFCKVFATNKNYTVYSEEISFTTKDVPTVSTNQASSITKNSARDGGNIINDGGSYIQSKGICYSTSLNPTLNDKIISAGSGYNNFTVTIINLEANTVYYVRAYARNKFGTGFGEQVTFKTLSN